MHKQSKQCYLIVASCLYGGHAQVKAIIGPRRVEHLFNLFQMSHMEAFTLISALLKSFEELWKMQLTPHVSACTPTHAHIFSVHSANACSKSGTAKPQLFFTHTLWFVCLLTDCTCASPGCPHCSKCMREAQLNLTALIGKAKQTLPEGLDVWGGTVFLWDMSV